MNIITIKDFRTLPWKNGFGSTQEILIYPNGADVNKCDFDYRISSALLTGESEFSFFKGYRRLLVLLNGSLSLIHTNPASGQTLHAELKDYEPHFFSGNDYTQAKVLGATEIRDFNFILLSEKYDVRCEIIKGEKELQLTPQKNYFLFSPNSVINTQQQSIKPNELGVFTSDVHESCTIQSATPAILIEIYPLGLASKSSI